MSKTKRKQFTSDFKAKVAIEAIRGVQTVNEIGLKSGVHPSQVGIWKEIARSKEMMIYTGSINRDHVHMLIGIPPNLSISRAVQYLKGKS